MNERRLIPLANLGNYCNPDSLTPVYRRPFQLGGWVFAADGPLAIRIPAATHRFDAMPALFSGARLTLDNLARTLSEPNPNSLLTPMWDRNLRWWYAPPALPDKPKFKPCSWCEGHGMVANCPTCEGTGNESCTHCGGSTGYNCPDCGGSGHTTPNQAPKDQAEICGECVGTGGHALPTALPIGLKPATYISDLVLRRLIHLDGLQISPHKEHPINHVMRFRFNGGDGWVMPMMGPTRG